MADEGFKRKLTAILSADVEGYSRLMGDDEESTVRTLTAYREVFFTLIQQHNGKVLDSQGDNLLAEFVSVVDAVQCGVAVQKEISARNTELSESRRMQFRIGINLGDVIQEEGRIYGDGVNIAARLEGLAKPGGICISKTAFDHIESKLPYGYEFLGDQTVKNIAKPVGAYRVLMQPRVTVAGEPKKEQRILGRRKPIFIGVTAVLVLAIAIGTWQFYERRPTVEPASEEKMAFPLPDKPSIVVLPFDNLSKDTDQEYISDAFTENIIATLSNNPRLFVISRNSSYFYKNKAVKISQVSEELGVQYVLEGSLLKSGDKLRVTAQLIDALKGGHLFAETYNREMKELFELIDDITMNIAEELAIKLTHGEEWWSGKKPKNIESMHLVLKGNEFLEMFTKAGNTKAKELFSRAAEQEPDLAGPWCLLASCYANEARYRWSESPKESFKKAIEAVNKAIELEEKHVCGNIALGVLSLYRRNYDKALAALEKAARISPSSAATHLQLGRIFQKIGRLEESIAEYKKALRLEPHYPPGWLSGLGRTYYLAKRYAEAEVAMKDVLELIRKGGSFSPKWPHLILSAIYIETGREEEARAHMQKVLEIDAKFNIEDRGKQSLFKDPEMNERELEAHRKAGAPERPPLKLPDKPSFAVLPFINMSGDPEQEYLSDGFTDTIIGALSKLPNVFIIARTSSFYYKGKSVTVKQVAQELGVQYVIEGSVQRSGDQLRVTVQMIDALTGGHVWSERYDRNMKDIFDIQDEITLHLVNSIKDKYNIRYVYPVVSATKNLEAYLKSIKAQYLFWDKISRANLEKARDLFEEAIALDSNYLFPYTWLPYVHQFEARRGYSKSPEKSLELGLKIAKKAVEMDETSSEALSALGYMYYNTKQYDKAIEIYKKAIDLGPNSPNSYDIGYALIYSGRPEEAITYFKKGERVSPKHFINSFRFGLAYLCMGKYEEAIPYYQEALKRLPGFDRLHVDLAACYAAAGRIEEAKVEVQHILEAIPNFSVEFYIKKLPARKPEDIKLFAEALRKIPIPE